MESDSIRAMGESTLVEVWINGKFRAIAVSRQAIEDYLQLTPTQKKALTEVDRVEFVRTRLSLVTSAAVASLREDPSAESIVIDDLGAVTTTSRSNDRRTGGDRRVGDRRKRDLGPPSGIERRR